jgi:phytoene synthase
VSFAPEDVAAVEAIVKAAGTSFYRGMAVLPADRRAAMFGIYAFCRFVDDIADDDATPLEAREPLLEAWRARIDALYAGQADDAVTRVLRDGIAAFGLRRADFQDVIDGMRMDAEAIVAPDLATLDLYCDRVAASVGRLSVRAFGDSSEAADEVAYHLGRALQLTNILRDIAEDAARGRLYLPAPYLAEAGVPADPQAAIRHPALPRAAERLAADAQRHFTQADAAMARCDRRAMRPARLMGDTYATILKAVRKDAWRDLSRRVSLSPWAKLGILVRHYLR